MAISPDGRTLVTGSGDDASSKGEARLWDDSHGQAAGSSPSRQQGTSPPDGRVSPDGRTVCPPSLAVMYNQRLLYVGATHGPADGPVLAHQERVSAVAFTPTVK